MIGVALLDESDDVLLATRQGKAIRFAGDDVREFQSRNSTGVRGMRLAPGDEVISLSILHRVGTSSEEREAYLRAAPWYGDYEIVASSESLVELTAKGANKGGMVQRLADLLVDLRRRGVAVVVIEHHMDLIMAIADRIVVIDQGRKLAEGTPAEIQRNEAVLEAYLGRAA